MDSNYNYTDGVIPDNVFLSMISVKVAKDLLVRIKRDISSAPYLKRYLLAYLNNGVAIPTATVQIFPSPA